MQHQFASLLNDKRIYEIAEQIGLSFKLDTDQISEIDFEIQKILLGQATAENLAGNLSNALELGSEVSAEIARVINDKILSRLQEWVDANNSDDHISAIEQAGGFEIERPTGTLPSTGSINLLAKEPVAEPKPIPATPTVYPKKEPLVEQLLRGSTAMPEQKITRDASPIIRKSTPPVPPRPSGNDPYRESIE